jgi:hypothetical protein
MGLSCKFPLKPIHWADDICFCHLQDLQVRAPWNPAISACAWKPNTRDLDVVLLMGVWLVGTKTTRAKPLSNRKIIRRYGDKLRWLATSIPFSQGPWNNSYEILRIVWPKRGGKCIFLFLQIHASCYILSKMKCTIVDLFDSLTRWRRIVGGFPVK